MKKTLVLLALALMIGCKDNDSENISRNVFKLTVASDASFYANAVWIAVRNSDTGELIDYEKLAPGSNVSFDTDQALVNDMIDVAFLFESLYSHDGVIDKTYEAEVYTQVKAGTEWKVNNPSSGSSVPDEVGTYQLNVTSVPKLFSVGLGDKYGRTDGYSFSSGYIGGKIDLHSNTPTQILSIDDGQTPKYTFLENLEVNDVVNISYNSLQSFDRLIEVKWAAPADAAVNVYAGDDSGVGYPLYDNTFFSEFFVNGAYDVKRTSVKVPILNRFSLYFITITNGNFYYQSFGPAPTTIDYVNPSVISITDNSMENFSFTSTKTVDRRRATFAYYAPFGAGARTSSIFHFHSGPEKVKYNQPFPEKLVNQLSIPVDNIKYSGSYYTIGDTYADLLKRNKSVDGETFYPTPGFTITEIYHNAP